MPGSVRVRLLPAEHAASASLDRAPVVAEASVSTARLVAASSRERRSGLQAAPIEVVPQGIQEDVLVLDVRVQLVGVVADAEAWARVVVIVDVDQLGCADLFCIA